VLKLVKGHAAILLRRPAPTLIISDLHLGFEEEMRSRGINVPPQSWKIVGEVISLARSCSAKRLIILGDVKHHFAGGSGLEWRTLPSMFRRIKEHVPEVLLLPGNHDGGIRNILGDMVEYLPSRGFYVEDEKVGLMHGHVWPSHSLIYSKLLITGHVHPVATLSGSDGRVRRRVWLRLTGDRRRLAEKVLGLSPHHVRGQVELIVMPSFNSLLSGRQVTELGSMRRGGGPLLRSGIFDLSSAEAILLDGTSLGPVSSLVVEA